MIDVAAALDVLAASQAPLLIGVRHHSPACARAMPALLDAFRPTRVLIELPADLGHWLPWLGHAETLAPVALAAVRADAQGLGFYPFADFSPELAAARWAVAHGVTLEACDLPYGTREARAEADAKAARGGEGVLRALGERFGSDDVEALWDRMVEAPAFGAEPEALRRAALLFGWTLRHDEAARRGISASDLQREAFMRARLAACGAEARVVAVIGAFHAPALLAAAEPLAVAAAAPVTTSLIAYAWDLLDSRSGYPAGIRDPAFQDRMLRVGADPAEVVATCAAEVVRALRRRGHPAGVPEAREAARVALDLATLRGLPAPGRRELVEALETVLTHGEVLGRGRAVAAAMEEVLVGDKRGQLPPGAPRSGLVPHVEALARELGLPGPGDAAKELRLDPLRSALDRRRERALQRLAVLSVAYGEPVEGAWLAGTTTLTSRWKVHWQPATSAMLALAGLRGVTLAQAAEGRLRERAQAADAPGELVSVARQAAQAGLTALTEERLAALGGAAFLGSAGLADLYAAAVLVLTVSRGQLPALGDTPISLPPEAAPARFLAALIAALDGIAGSRDVADARHALDVVRLFEGEGALGDGRLAHILGGFLRSGSPLMQGAAGPLLAAIGRMTPEAVGERLAGFMSAPAEVAASRSAAVAATHADLAQRIAGALAVAGPLFEADPGFIGPLDARIAALSQAEFLSVLPALRDGFEVLSTAGRQRLLDALDDGQGWELAASPEESARWAAADHAGLLALAPFPSELVARPDAAVTAPAVGDKSRWRLVLGRERQRLPPALQRHARALDMLYGHGHGEGSRGDGGGADVAFPSVREWSEEIEALFGTPMLEEVLGRAAERGIPAALTALDPETVTPSIDLLERMLALRGALPEAHLGAVRRIIARCVEAVTRELARTLRPALIGVSTARTTRRRGVLDLGRTLARNLARAQRLADGRVRVIPEVPLFKARAQRSVAWRVVLVVDVSGSMERSVLYSAMMAAILSGIPWVAAHFLAFSTEVVDLSGHVADPLALLLEVKVGGGTAIGRALRHARSLITVPSRTVVLLITDFEEGGSPALLLNEVAALVESGAQALGLAALDDTGVARYSAGVASQVVEQGMPVAALTPLELARWLGERLR